MTTPTVMVQMADTKWTKAAVEVACQKALIIGAELALVEMIACECLNWQGIEPDEYVFSESELDDIELYKSIAKVYGVPVSVHVFKYDSLADAIARAADELNADAVFVTLPSTLIPFLRERQILHLSHLLEEHHHHLYSIEQPAVTSDWTPEARAVR